MITHEARYPGISEEEFELIITVLNMYAGGYHPRDDINFHSMALAATELASKLRRMSKTHDDIDPTGHGAAFRQIRRG